MNKNNKTGKERWVQRYFSSEMTVIVVLPSQTKKEALNEKYGVSVASQCALVDDLDKNAKLFGSNGYLIQSAGDVRLQNFMDNS